MSPLRPSGFPSTRRSSHSSIWSSTMATTRRAMCGASPQSSRSFRGSISNRPATLSSRATATRRCRRRGTTSRPCARRSPSTRRWMRRGVRRGSVRPRKTPAASFRRCRPSAPRSMLRCFAIVRPIPPGAAGLVDVPLDAPVLAHSRGSGVRRRARARQRGTTGAVPRRARERAAVASISPSSRRRRGRQRCRRIAGSASIASGCRSRVCPARGSC